MNRIVECVPNFSEGMRKETIEAIANAITATEGCSLLDVDPGISTNRTVYTFVGDPESVVEGALNAARVAATLIDMTRHKGEHPRMGALDICPFVPIRGVQMEECVECAKEFGRRLAAEINVPVYLVGEAQDKEYRKELPDVREGEYEGLPEKLSDPRWEPDFGPAELIPFWGATCTSARKPLIAYNVNTLSTKEQAHRVALNIREQGRTKDVPGRLKKVRAIGWYLEESNVAQVSCNLLDYEVTGIHEVYEECCRQTQELNLAVCGSQIVGLVPLSCMLKAAEHYMQKENLFILEEDQKIRLVVTRLGLNSVSNFNPRERIIEYMLGLDDRDGPLQSMELKDFVMTIAARTPSPGGGSVSAAMAAMGAALGSMVGFLSYGNKKFAPQDAQMRRLLPGLYAAVKELTPYVDADAAAYAQFMAACKLPEPNDDEKEMKRRLKESSLMNAAAVPLSVARIVNDIWPQLKELAACCNINCKSDLQVGARSLETAVWGCYYNVNINIKDLEDSEFKKSAQEEIEQLLGTAQDSCAEVLKTLSDRE